MFEAKLASKARQTTKPSSNIGDRANCGGVELFIIGGPCSVEDAEQMEKVASTLSRCPRFKLSVVVFTNRERHRTPFKVWAKPV